MSPEEEKKGRPARPIGGFLEDGFNLPVIEEKILEFWEENRVFEKTLEKTEKGEPYTFYDGPPFATGLPHYGHILASTIKDLIPRYQTMKGRYVRRRWGWDCHGLPIEEIVERHLGISGKKQIEEIGIEKFNATCREKVLEYAGEWKKMVRRIARWTEFDNSYKTMDRDYMESVWWAFKQFYEKGLVYEGRKVLMYCPRCETPISNFEVAMDNSYKDVEEETVTAKFKVKPGQKIGDWEVPENTYLLAWTTTPWTLPGNVALAVGEDMEYVIVESGVENYVLAKDRLVILSKAKDLGLDSSATPQNDTKIISELKGLNLVDLKYEPLFDVPAVQNEKTFQVYPADFVTTEEGTGIVHTAVVYGEDDYNLGQKYGLPVVPLLDEKGKFNDKAPEDLRGKYFKDADKYVLDDLEKRGLVLSRAPHTHSYPHCWRCGNPLFYNAIPAWFVNIQKIKKGLLDSNNREMNWFPGHLKHGRYEKSVEQAPDWNISRNRYWGNPIPVWKCESCGENKVVGSIKELGLKKNIFLFTRHGEGENNVLGLNNCWPEPKKYNLTKEGVVRARNLAGRLKNEGGIDIIFASDITRTKETAQTIASILGVPVEFDARLRELGVGDYNGKSYLEFEKDYPAQDRWTKHAPGGESRADVQKRMVSFTNEINQKYSGKKILIVSHGDPLYVLMQYYGSELPFPNYTSPFELDVDIVDLHRPYIDKIVLKCEKCGGEARRTKEIFDSWIEAGSMPFAEYHYPFDQKEIFESRIPAQFVAEYIPQTRAWFYLMHVISYVLFGKAPVSNLVTTGTILAEDGSKMSKSKNNFPDPWLMIEKYGVDALRFYLMGSPLMQAGDLNFSERELGNVYRKTVLIPWNVLNYFLTYAPKNVEDRLEIEDIKNVLDKWIWARTKELVNGVTDSLDAYDTVRATRTIAEYVDDLSTWYLRRSRGRADNQFFGTLRHTLINLAKVMAPTMPYASELIYKNLTVPAYQNLTFRSSKPDPIAFGSVHLANWPTKQEVSKEDTELLRQMKLIRDAASLGMAKRKELNIPVRQPLPKVSVGTQEKIGLDLKEILLAELNVKSVEIISQAGLDVQLDTVISDELRLEGLVRGLERAVQALRKEEGLKVGEMASTTYLTADQDLDKAIPMINKGKTYISEITRGEGGREFELDGKRFTMSIKKVRMPVSAKAVTSIDMKVIRKDGRTEEAKPKRSSNWISKMFGK